MTYYHLVFIFYLILISSCKNDTKSSYVSQIEFIEKYKDFQFDQNRIEQAIRLGLLNFDEVDYSYPQKGSPYKYELLGPSFHKVLWFDLETIDQDAFKNEQLENLGNYLKLFAVTRKVFGKVFYLRD